MQADDPRHAVEHPIIWADLGSDADPFKVLAIGPDRSGNLLEVVLLDLEGGWLAIHAMRLRPIFAHLLPR